MYLKTRENKKPRIFLLVGAPFSGKSTIAKDLALKYEAEIISKPDIKRILFHAKQGKNPSSKQVFRCMLSQIVDCVCTNRNVVIDGTFITTAQRERLLKVLNDLGEFESYLNSALEYKRYINSINFLFYEVIGVYIKPNYELAQHKNKECNFPISVYDLEEQYRDFEKPCKSEGFNKIITRRAQ